MKKFAAAVALATVIPAPALAQTQVIDYRYVTDGGTSGYYVYGFAPGQSAYYAYGSAPDQSVYYAYGYVPPRSASAPRRSARSAFAAAPRRSARSAFAAAPRRSARSAFAAAPGLSGYYAYGYAPGQEFPFYSPQSPLPWRPSPFNVFDTTGNYIGTDPDPIVRDQLARDPRGDGGGE
jgi:hypothetical protein